MNECSHFIDIILSNNDNYHTTYQSKEFSTKKKSQKLKKNEIQEMPLFELGNWEQAIDHLGKW